MAIPKFYGQWLKRRGFRGVLQKGLPGVVSSLAIDMNGLIHKTAQYVYAYGDYYSPEAAKRAQASDPIYLEGRFHETLGTNLMNVITLMGPIDALLIAIDGVAPGAKIQQQRQRRYRFALSRSPDQVFDSNAITPGTEFMMRLDRFLQDWIQTNRASLPPKLIYSSHMAAGEGEHKIMDLYRRGEVSGRNAPSNGAHVLYGMDADLIMLSLLSPLSGILLSREDIDDVINIDNLRIALGEELGGTTALEDFVTIMFLLGNDFLPHSPTLSDFRSSIDTMMQVYREVGLSLTGPQGIDWASLAAYLHRLSEREPVLLSTLSVKHYKYPSRFFAVSLLEGEFYPDYYRGAWYTNALGPHGDRPDLLPEQEFEELYQIGVEEVEEMAVQYLIGLAWAHVYYTEGTGAVNLNWWYPYHHSPLLVDLAAVASVAQDSITGYREEEGMFILNPLHQLLAVLPPASSALLPLEVRPLAGSSALADLFPLAPIIERDGVDEDWQGVALLPPADLGRIYRAVQDIRVNPKRAPLWNPSDHLVSYHTPDQSRSYQRFLQSRRQTQQRLNRYRPPGQKTGRGQTLPTAPLPPSGPTIRVPPEPLARLELPPPPRSESYRRPSQRGGRGGRGGRGSGPRREPTTRSEWGERPPLL